MDKIFLIDKNIITYQQLIFEINEPNSIFGLSEVESIVIDTIKKLVSRKISDYNDLISNIKETNSDIQLKTSGTTAKPKIINHTFESMTRNIKISGDRESDVWGFAYNPTKMAGYQVLFQSILNKNTLVNLFKCDYVEISKRILEYGVTNISATPTFYKVLISENLIYPNVKNISLGGEGSTKEFHDKLRYNFPNAKIKNIYASTEVSSLFASEGDVFRIPNKYKDLIKLDSNKLIVHKSLVGNSDNIKFDGEWYDTGDLIEVIDDSTFKITGRDGFLVNVGGYQINPMYIESKISEMDYVKLCKVYSKPNSLLGNIIICDIILLSDITVLEIKNNLKSILNDYEVPSKINIVSQIEINENGKINRK